MAGPPTPIRTERRGAELLSRRFLGVPWLFAVGYSGVAFSIYFAPGIVAERGLGLTPLILLFVGFAFVLATQTYVEGGAMFLERGGSTTLARYGFNELVSFIAGWAILIDYVIVIALAAITLPHYLSPISEDFTEGLPELLVAVGVIVFVAGVNIAGITGKHRQKVLVGLAVGDLLVQFAVIVAGLIVVFDPGLLTAELDLFSSPSLEDIAYAAVVGMVAFAGIEAASNLAPDFDFTGPGLRRTLAAGAITLPLVYTGIAVVGLMALPVTGTDAGLATPLSGEFVERPLLGIVQSYEPSVLADIMQWAVVAVAPAVLLFAASTAMLGLSRHTYVLARNRQIPSWLGKLGRRNATPHVTILIASLAAIGLVIPGDVVALAGVYAFGITLAVAIAHLSVVSLRFREPDRERPYRIAPNIRWRGVDVPVPALAGAVIMGFAWLSVIAFHEEARWLGGGWMAFGLISYFVYRNLFEGTSVRTRVTVPESALFKERTGVEYGTILVPVFGTKLDDDIVGTAGRLADAVKTTGQARPKIEVIYVLDLPLTVPLDAPPPEDRVRDAERALERAEDVGEEYENVDVAVSMVRARHAGAGIVAEARKRGIELIVMGAEPPTKIRGGAVLGGIGGSRPPEIGDVTEYVLRKAPCRVVLTAPPADVA